MKEFLLHLNNISSILVLVLWGAVIIFWFAELRVKMKDLEPIRQNAGKIIDAVNKVDGLVKEVSRLGSEMSEFKIEMAELKSEMSEFKIEMAEFKIGMAKLTKEVSRLANRPVAADHSPLSLNEFGQELSRKMYAPSIVEKYTEHLIDKAKTENMNAYQIQQSCISFATNELIDDLEEKDKNLFNEISDIAFNEGVAIETLTYVLGLELRDRVLKAVGKTHVNVNARKETARSSSVSASDHRA